MCQSAALPGRGKQLLPRQFCRIDRHRPARLGRQDIVVRVGYNRREVGSEVVGALDDDDAQLFGDNAQRPEQRAILGANLR